MRPRCSRDAAEGSRDAAEVQPRCGRGAAEECASPAGAPLGASSLDRALAGYDISATAAAVGMGERFSRGSWSMNAVGSRGAVCLVGRVGGVSEVSRKCLGSV